MGALSLKVPTGPGDVINVQGVYTDGATRYNFQSLFPSAIVMFGGTNVPGAYQSVGIASLADAVFVNGGGMQTVQSWGFRGGYTHNWNPYWASAIYGGWGELHYPGLAQTTICGALAASLIGTCNPNFSVGVVGGNVVWTPVKGFAFTVDVNWMHLDQRFSGTIGLIPPGSMLSRPLCMS